MPIRSSRPRDRIMLYQMTRQDSGSSCAELLASALRSPTLGVLGYTHRTRLRTLGARRTPCPAFAFRSTPGHVRQRSNEHGRVVTYPRSCQTDTQVDVLLPVCHATHQEPQEYVVEASLRQTVACGRGSKLHDVALKIFDIV